MNDQLGCSCNTGPGGLIDLDCPFHGAIGIPVQQTSERKLLGDPVALAERDIHAAAADLMLASREMMSIDDVLAAVRKLTGMRAALDSAASFLLTRAEELSNR